ncbi:MAG TPA: hypothetical protein DIW45_09665, partial [Erythrobacter sp.]|nr:hypothetical protein [Erythrobacter sp.]
MPLQQLPRLRVQVRLISLEPADCCQVPLIGTTQTRAAFNFGRLCFLCSLFTLFFFPATALEAAENAEQTEADLAIVTAAIGDIQIWLTDANARHSEEEKNLRDAEKGIAAVAQSAAATRRRLAETEYALEILHNRINRLE